MIARTHLPLGIAAALIAVAATFGPSPSQADPTPDSSTPLAFTWAEGEASAVSFGGTVQVGDPMATPRLTVTINNGTIDTIPTACETSDIKTALSWLTPSGNQLICSLNPQAAAPVQIALRVSPDATGLPLGGLVEAGPGVSVAIPERSASMSRITMARQSRLVSSPDFLNADVADLRTTPNYWSPSKSQNSTNAAYETALANVLSTWRGLAPDGVLVAGDLVDGRWGYDDRRTGVFGPVGTRAQQEAALRMAARTYYPAWQRRMLDHGLTAYPTPGDHEYGDNDWGSGRKRQLLNIFEEEWGRAFGKHSNGSPRYADRPRNSVHEFSAYAIRPNPSVQIVSINVFDIRHDKMKLGVDGAQLEWLDGVLAQARADGVPWIIVQGHTPILGPVRERASSGLMYPGAENSALWKVLAKHRVNLYFAGEVHDISVLQRDGVTQISHGGLFQFGLTNFLVTDVYPDHLSLSFQDFNTDWSDNGAPRLWETRRRGMPSSITVQQGPMVIGTADLKLDGSLENVSGIAVPLHP